MKTINLQINQLYTFYSIEKKYIINCFVRLLNYKTPVTIAQAQTSLLFKLIYEKRI